MRMTAIQQAVRSLSALMTDCDALVRTMMQWLGETPTATIIDREIGDLRNDTIGGQKWLTYVRYNATLEGAWLRTQLKLEIEDVEAAGLRAMDVPGNVAQLAHVGATAAAVQVRPEHLPPQFDI
jgi:hypothetical protein